MTETAVEPNVKLAVPFFNVTDMDVATRFYTEALGFKITKKWEPEGKLRWCWMELDGVAMMLQRRNLEKPAPAEPGANATISFQCKDALAIYNRVKAKGYDLEKPFVGNGMWVVTICDPDGFRLEFESITDVAEGTELNDLSA